MKFLRVIIIALVVSTSLVYFKPELMLLNLVASVVLIIISNIDVQSVRLFFVSFFSDTWGYYVRTDKNEERFIQRTVFIPTADDKFIMVMNSIIAFFYICINYNKELGEQNLNLSLDKLYESLENKSMVFCLPIFTIGFFMYIDGNRNEKLRECYKEIVGIKDNSYLFERMLQSQIFYLTKYLSLIPIFWRMEMM